MKPPSNPQATTLYCIPLFYFFGETIVTSFFETERNLLGEEARLMLIKE
jgi:hypothetical protein